MERAVRALEQTDYETAASLFDEVIGEGKDLQYAYRGKGIALMGMMEYAEAEEAFRTALDSEVWTDRFTYGDDLKKDIEQFLAVCCVRTGEYEEAIALYDTLIEEIGETPDLLTDRGTAKVGAGMITGWGSHHLDIVHWAMGWEGMGAKYIEGKGKFHTGGLWDVHGEYDITLTYPDGSPVRVWDKFPNGVRFIGEKGWIFVSRGAAKMTASNPVSPGRKLKALDASDPALIAGNPSVVLYPHMSIGSRHHHQNLIDAIKGNYESLVPAETAHRSCTACLLSWIGMKLGRKLEWNWKKEQFVNDAEANAMLEREERAPYGAKRAYQRLSKKAAASHV
jgi:tetratricopeptide (TPR) repeat protein